MKSTLNYVPVSFDDNKIVSGNTVYLYDNGNIDTNKYNCCLCNIKQQKWVDDYDDIHGIQFGIKKTETFCRLCDECYDILGKYDDDGYLSYKIINKKGQIYTAKYSYFNKY
jgi:hypothetical protein